MFFWYNKKNKTYNDMIFIVWLALICCSIANGILFACKELPYRWIYIICSSLVGLFFLCIYNHHTKKWCKNIEGNQSIRYDNKYHYRDPLFYSSAMASFIFLIFGCVAGINPGIIVGIVTAFVLFAIAAIRESKYL